MDTSAFERKVERADSLVKPAEQTAIEELQIEPVINLQEMRSALRKEWRVLQDKDIRGEKGSPMYRMAEIEGRLDAIDKLVEKKVSALRDIWESVDPSIRNRKGTVIVIEDDCGKNHVFGKDAAFMNYHHVLVPRNPAPEHYAMDDEATRILENMDERGEVNVHFVPSPAYAAKIDMLSRAEQEGADRIYNIRAEEYGKALGKYKSMSLPRLVSEEQELQEKINKAQIDNIRESDRAKLEARQEAVKTLIERKDAMSCVENWKDLRSEQGDLDTSIIICESELGNEYAFGYDAKVLHDLAPYPHPKAHINQYFPHMKYPSRQETKQGKQSSTIHWMRWLEVSSKVTIISSKSLLSFHLPSKNKKNYYQAFTDNG